MLDFAGIGAQKCGTTWLHRKLSQHPHVCFPAGKEVHFWDNKRERGIAYYQGLFPANDGPVQGEITPAYGILPRAVIAECHHFFPELRLIYIIRNPLDRAWSHAKMAARVSGLDPATLPDAWFLEHFRSAGSLARGDYETCLRNWLSEYREEQLLLLFFEELALSPACFLAKCCRHLGLANIYGGEQPGARQRIFEGPPVMIRPRLHAALRQIYSRKISALGAFLKKDLSAWFTWETQCSPASWAVTTPRKIPQE